MGLSLSESQLEKYASCSWYLPLDPSMVTLEAPAREAFRWAVRERFFGKLRTPQELRTHFLALWSKAWTGEKTEAYWAGPKAAPGFARRTYEFLVKHRVERPYEPYALRLAEGTITGHNAIVLWESERKRKIPYVLDMQLRRPRDRQVPDYPGIAQWAAAREESESTTLGIVHVPVLMGDRYSHRDLDEALARGWLNAIVKTAAGTTFPQVGSQCRTCTHPCKDVFDGPDDDRWT